MKTVFGIFARLSDYISLPALEKMAKFVCLQWNINDYQLWECAGIGLGQALNKSSSDSNTYLCSVMGVDDIKFVAAGRLDNASDICRSLNISETERELLSDTEVLKCAYIRWGKDSFAHLFGDWVLAAWHPLEKQLVLARSHHGNVPLYYFINNEIFAFAVSRQALMELQLAPTELDELYLAQQLISWPGYQSDRTLHKTIKRLQPAHYLIVTQNSFITKRYWFPEDNPQIQLYSRIEYVDVFRSLFDEAVSCRIRSDTDIAVSLSGGLDSSSVAVTAARLLAKRGQRLTAFTSVPLFDTHPYVQERFGDEFPFVKAIADYAGNIDINPLASQEISPIAAIRRVLHLQRDVCHGAANLFWVLDVRQTAMAAGHKVLLTGAAGNGSISWTGDIFSQPWSFLLSHVAWRTLLNAYVMRTKKRIKSNIPTSCLVTILKRRMENKQWYRRSAIHPDFAGRIRLLEQYLQASGESRLLTAREQISQIIMPGRSLAGSNATELGAAHGLEVRDPTADARIIDFIYSVPDHIFMDPKTGIDRYMIREAMKGRLPDEVRLNRQRGWQAGDLVPRLRIHADEVEIALDELAHGPAAMYVDVDYMRQVWRMIQAEDTMEAFIKSITILTRGIMAGLFVNQFYE